MVDTVSDGTTLEAGPERTGSEDHIALIYETAEERLAAVTPLIKVGLEKGELCLYISGQEDDQEIVEALKAEHIDVDKAVEAGGLILTHKGEIYFKTGRFDPEWTLRVITNVADLARSYGFTAMRIMTDMSWTLENVPGVERWAEYEAKLSALSPGICVRIICQYDRRAFSAEALLWALRTHPKVVAEGAVYHNPFFVSPEQVLKGEHAVVELERIMESIRSSSASEAELQVRDSELAQLQDRLEQETRSRMEVELALSQAAQRFNDLAERTSDWAWELGEDGTYTYASPRIRDILGLQVEEVLGLTPMDLVHPEDAESVAAVLVPALSSRAPITALEKRARHRDGHSVYLEMSGAPLFDPDGTFRGYRGIDRDITGRRASKRAIDESRQRMEEAAAQVATAEARIAELEAEAGQLRGVVAERDAAMAALNEALGRKEGERLESAQELERLRLELSERQAAVEQAIAAMGERETEMAGLHARQELLQQEQRDLEAELARLREELAAAQAVAESTGAEVPELRALLEAKAADLAEAAARYEEQEGRLAARCSELGMLRNEVRMLRSRERDALDALAAGKDEAQQARARLDAATAELRALRARAEEKEEELARLREELESKIGVLQNEVRELRAREQDALAAAAAKDERVAALSVDLAAKATEAKELRSLLDSRTNELAEMVVRSEEAQAALVAQADARGSELGMLRNDLRALRSRERDALDALEAKRAEVGAMSARLETMAGELAAAHKELEPLRAAVGGMEKVQGQQNEELASARAEVQRHLAEVETLQDRLREKEAELANAATLLEGTRAELATSRAREEDLERSFDLLVQEKDGLAVQLRATDSELGRLRNEIRALRSKEDERTAIITAKGIEISMLKQRLSKAEDEVARLTQALNASEVTRDQEGVDEALAKVALLEASLAKTSKELADATARLGALLGQTVAAIACIDPEGKVLEANGAFCALVGREAGEVIGRSYRELTHRDDLVESSEAYRRAMSGEAPVTLRKRYVRRYGDIACATVSLSAVRDAQGRPLYLMEVASDRTDLMLAEAALVEREQERDAAPTAATAAGPAADRAVDIARRLNDALTVITGCVSLAKEYVIPEGRMFSQLGQIERASAEVGRLVSELHAAARGQEPSIAERPEPAPYRPAELVPGRGKVLLVDGDEGVLEATGDMLRHLGYTVEVARDGAEASAVLAAAREGQPFQALIADVGAPGLRNAVIQMARENPELKLIASSGDLADPAMAAPAAHGFAVALPRPYAIEALSKAVSEALRGPQGKA